MIRDLIEGEGVGEDVGGVGYTEVEIDAPTLGELGMRYMVRLFISCSDLLYRDRQGGSGGMENVQHVGSNADTWLPWRGRVIDQLHPHALILQSAGSAVEYKGHECGGDERSRVSALVDPGGG